MPTLNARASVVAATNNTTWSNTANAIDGTFGTNNATYSVWTNTTANAVGYIELGFGTQFSGIPANAVITNISVTLRHLVSNASRITSVTFQPYDGTTAIGSAFACTISTTARSDTQTFTPTLAQLKSANFKIRATATRFKGTQAGTFSIDYIDVVVTYVIPPVADFSISNTEPLMGSPVTFTDTSTNGPTTWAWTFTGGTPASASTQGPHSVSFDTPGVKDITLVVTNAAGSNQITKQITVSDLPPAEVWNGTSWKGGEVWNGTAWVTPEFWNGTRWVPLKAPG